MNAAWWLITVVAAAPTQDELLQHVRANTQHTLPPVRLAYRVDTEWSWTGWGEPRPHPDNMLDVTTLRWNAEIVTVYGDAERIDITTERTTLYDSDTDGETELISSNQCLWNGTTAYRISEGINPPRNPSLHRDPSPANGAWTKARGLPGAPALAATFPGDAHTLADYLEHGEEVEIQDAMEAVDGVPCVKVVIESERGTFTVWLDPDASYLMRKARVVKLRDHLVYRDNKPVHAGEYCLLPDTRVRRSEWEYARGESMETTVDRIQIPEVEGRHFISGARIVQETRYDKDRIQRRTTTLSMNLIELDPDFESAGAFVVSSLPFTD